MKSYLRERAWRVMPEILIRRPRRLTPRICLRAFGRASPGRCSRRSSHKNPHKSPIMVSSGLEYFFVILNEGQPLIGVSQPPPKSKGGKMLGLINWRLKVTLNDGRALVGQMLAFDRHMNLVLAECEEFRRVRPKKRPGETEAGPVSEIKRALGLVILRGETVVSLSVEGPPPVVDDDKKNAVSEIFQSVPNEALHDLAADPIHLF